jgi:putative N6-adenine-specific DNA methylase
MIEVFTKPGRIIVTCSKRLAPFLEKELMELGYLPAKVFPTGVELRGTVNDCISLNLTLRCASQVLYGLREMAAKDPEELYERLSAIPWEDLIPSDGYFSVTSNVNTPSVNNELFVNVRVKDAIVDRIRKQTGSRPNSGSELNQAVVHLYWKEDRASVFIDTAGETLAKHGYRKIPGKAPMLEALAAATIMATSWDRRAPFINPMCGSGTLAIEAALIATNRHPGLYRSNYSFMHFSGYDRSIYDRVLEGLNAMIQEPRDLKIVATDNSLDALKISMVNAKSAGIDHCIHFEKVDFEKTNIPAGPGVVFFNPEYGERLGRIHELEQTYRRIGDFMKNKCKGYTGYVFTGNMELAKKIGLRASRRIEFYSAKIDCRLLEYELYAGKGSERGNRGFQA